MQARRSAAIRLAPAAFALALLAAGGAHAAERVGVDAGLHEGFARIVFAWPAKVDFEVKLDGTKLTIHFARPLTADLQVIAQRIDEYVESVAMAGDSDVVANLRRPFGLHSFPTEDKVAIDLLDKPAPTAPAREAEAPQKPASAADGKNSPSGVPVSYAQENGTRRLVFEWPQPTSYTVSTKDGEAQLRFKQSGPVDIAQLAAEAADLVPRSSESGKDLTVTLRLPTGSHLRTARDGNHVVVTISTDALKSTNEKTATTSSARPAATAPTSLLPAARPPAPEIATPPHTVEAPKAPDEAKPDSRIALKPPSDEPAPLPPRSPVGDDGATLRFELQKPAPAAVFRQGTALWVVFGAVVPIDLADLRAQGQPVVRSIDQVPSDAATILRLATSGGFNPSLRRSQSGWVLELRQQLLQPDAPVGVSLQAAAQPPRILFPVREPASPVVFRDPELGETLIAVPLDQVGLGAVRELKLVDLTVLLTAQGLAFRPLSDGVAVKSLPNGVEVTSAAGLALSDDHDRALRRGTNPQRLFDFTDWYGPKDGTVLAERRALEQNIVAAAPASRSGARLDLAHFYFAHGLGAEAIGVMQAIERDDPNFAADPRVRAVAGGAMLLAERPEDAERDLELSALDGEPEIALWRGALAVGKHDMSRAASEFAKGAIFLRRYPKELRHRFALEAAEAAVATGQQDDAQEYLAMVKDAPGAGDAAMAQLLTARALRLAGEGDSARAILDKLAGGPDRQARARAELERTLDDLEAGTIKRGDAIKKLDGLRFAWRGDDFELAVVRRLGELRIKDGDFRGGFDALHQAVDNFADHPEHRAIEQQLADSFSDIFAGPGADNVPPLKALAFFEEFKGMMPPGAKGDEIIRRLADRLVAIDLLDRASELLDNQVRTRLTGREKARVAARLAVVRLLDRKPQEALAALDIDVGTDIDADLKRQRQQLRARALSDLGRTDEALKIIADDRSRDADRLRADIAWRTKNWAEAAKIFEHLAVAPDATGKLGKEDARLVLDWATALTLSGDQAGVAQLAATYAVAMEAGPLRDAFRVVTGDPSAAKGDIRQLAGKVAQISDLQSFMAGYRQKLSTQKLSAIN